MDIAEVGLIAHSSSVRTATRDMDHFNKKGKETEKATSKVNRALDTMIKNFFALVRRLRLIAAVVGGVSAAFLALRTDIMAASAAAAGAFVDVKLDPFRDRLRSVSKAAVSVQDNLKALTGIASDAGVMFLSVGEGMSLLDARMIAAGRSIADTRDTISGFTRNLSGLGTSADDINSKLDDIADLAGQATVKMSDLQGAVDYTNDPIHTLAQAFGVTDQRIRQLIDSNAELSGRSLVVLGQYLGTTAQKSEGLTASFSRLVNTATDLFNKFNRSGVIAALTAQFQKLGNYLQSEQVASFMQRMSKAAIHLISDTLPGLAKSFVTNWHTIVKVVESATGFLIGTAVGGLPGGVIGALIGGSEQARKALVAFGSVTASKLAGVGRDLKGNQKDFDSWQTNVIGDIAQVLDTITKVGAYLGFAINTLNSYATQTGRIVHDSLIGDFADAKQAGIDFKNATLQGWKELQDSTAVDAYSNSVKGIIDDQKKAIDWLHQNQGQVGPTDTGHIPYRPGYDPNKQTTPSRPQWQAPDLSGYLSTLDQTNTAQAKQNQLIQQQNSELQKSYRIGQGIQQQLNDRVHNTVSNLRTPQAKAMSTYDQQIDDLISAQKGGLINQQQYIQKAGLAWKQYKATADSALTDTSEFARRAASNIQDTLGNTLQQTLQGHFDGILSSWVSTLQEMASQAAAAGLGSALLGKGFGKTGQVGGLLGGAIGGLGSLLGGGSGNASKASILDGSANPISVSSLSGIAAPALGGGTGGLLAKAGSVFGGFLANGGPVSANKGYVVGDGGEPEWFQPGTSGSVTPFSQMGGGNSGGGSSSPTFNVTYNEAPGKSQDERDNDRGQFMAELEQIAKQATEQHIGEMVGDGSFDKFMAPYTTQRAGHI